MNKKIKIGYYCADFLQNNIKSLGILKVTKNLLNELIKSKNVEITLITSDENIELFKEFKCKKEIISSQKPYWFNKLFGFPIEMKDIVKTNRLEVLFFPKGQIPLWKIPKIKYYTIIHDLIPFYYVKNKKISSIPVSILIWWTMKKADKIFTNSEYSKSQLKKYSKKEIIVLPLGVNIVKPKKPKLKKDSFVFVIGNNNFHKNLDLSKKSIENYNKIYKTNYKIFTSNGKLSEEELAGYYNYAKFSIFLSSIEGFGLPMIESYAYGTPIVFNNKTSLAEIGKELKGKCYIEDEQSIFNAINEIEKMSEGEIEIARKKLLEKYNWKNSAKKIVENLD